MLKNLFIIKYITLLINKNQNNFNNNLEKYLYIQNIKKLVTNGDFFRNSITIFNYIFNFFNFIK